MLACGADQLAQAHAHDPEQGQRAEPAHPGSHGSHEAHGTGAFGLGPVFVGHIVQIGEGRLGGRVLGLNERDFVRAEHLADRGLWVVQHPQTRGRGWCMC